MVSSKQIQAVFAAIRKMADSCLCGTGDEAAGSLRADGKAWGCRVNR